LHYAEVKIPMELGAEINITCRSPQIGAEVIRAEHRLPFLVTIREVEERNGIGSTNQYSVDCLLVSIGTGRTLVADLNQFTILDRLFLVHSH